MRTLRAAFYPRLLPVARDWAARLRQPAPWPDSPDEWPATCHAAGLASGRLNITMRVTGLDDGSRGRAPRA